MVIELESAKTRISAPAHPFATGIGRVSGLVIVFLIFFILFHRGNGSKKGVTFEASYTIFFEDVCRLTNFNRAKTQIFSLENELLLYLYRY